MGYIQANTNRSLALPSSAPETVQLYLAHVAAGISLRDLSRICDCHASTMMRRVRRVEQMRDDPLFDAAIRRIEDTLKPKVPGFRDRVEKDLQAMSNATGLSPQGHRDPEFEKEAMRVLRRLCETGAVLAIAADMDMAVVVREGVDGGTTRTAVVSQGVAQGMSLEGWIETSGTGRILRYTLTPTGREAVRRYLERTEPNGSGIARLVEMAEAPAHFETSPQVWGDRGQSDEESARKTRYNLAESPLTALARRKDKSGEAFLDESLVRCGERLREDFELAQMETQSAHNWDQYLTVAHSPLREVVKGYGPEAAKSRVVSALQDLGPGLSDIVLRCCCYLEGLEITEQRMGWSARSGKIVLRIALQRLKRHYDETMTEESNMIG